MLKFAFFGCLVALFSHPSTAQQPGPQAAQACAPCIRAELSFLASDAMRGRGSGTHDEELAATYVGTELMRFGIDPAGDNGTYIQTAALVDRSAAAPPVLTFSSGAGATRWTHGREMVIIGLPDTSVSGPLQKLKDAASPVQRGAMVLMPATASQENAAAAANAGAAMVLMVAGAAAEGRFARMARTMPSIGAGAMGPRNFILMKTDAAALLAALPDGSVITVTAEAGPEQTRQTWNAIGILRGSDPALAQQAVLLSAHLDHLGIGPPVNGDEIYNGADDDASGTVAVLQMARLLGSGTKPKRTVVFALFGSEEKGGLGSQWFLQHSPVPLDSIVANLEFEMIGRPDPKVKPDELWLTGWERSNLGPTLAQHGAKLVGDPHPEQNFFRRSDNIVLARRGVVAQTVSSFGLHPDYHRPSDDLQHISFEHMDRAIGSMLAPVQWLVNSDFKPQWVPGQKP